MKKLAYIDTMRGIAILLVIACHCAYYIYDFLFKNPIINVLTRGQVGVQLFFVASALTLCLSMEKRGYSPRSLKEFFIRRYFRIAPMYYLGIIIYFITNYFFINRYNSLLITYFTPFGILSNALFIHGFIPAYNNSIVPGGWSIGAEMAFYVCFPFLFIWLKAKSFLYILRFLMIYSIIALAIILGQYTIYHQAFLYNNSFYYYNFFNQLPVFIWGFLLYKQIKLNIIQNVYAQTGIMVTGFILFFFVWRLEQTFAASFFLVPLFAGMGVFGLGAILQRYNYNFKLINSIGQLSFSIYIFHFLSTHYFFPYLYEHYLYHYTKNALLIFLLCFFITLIPTYLLALLTRKYIEQPFISVGDKLISKLTK